VRYARPPVPNGMLDWTTAKPEGIASGLFPFGQMPVLVHKQPSALPPEVVPQSRAIMNYLGRLAGLYGGMTHPLMDMKVDAMIGGIEDVKGKWRAHFYGKDKTAEDIAAALPKYLEEVPAWLGFLEKLKAKNGGTWMVGEKITLADYYAFETLDQALRTAPTLLDRFPGLKAFVPAFASRPNIKSYLEGTHGGPLRVAHTGGPDTEEAPGAGAEYLTALLAEHDKEL
jgi:glutathione S-transferase